MRRSQTMTFDQGMVAVVVEESTVVANYLAACPAKCIALHAVDKDRHSELKVNKYVQGNEQA